ncbi:MAG: hypothetical protein MZU91_07315 [Desulfosudis oleivorans]|nr:hypothetical protein [Desulfosudis oleivorans]
MPNPEYLFLSKSHEEALAHLNYAIAQGDGFVEITGEVGTGQDHALPRLPGEPRRHHGRRPTSSTPSWARSS